MKNAFTIIAILIFSKMSYAQNIQRASDTAAIKQTMNNFVDAMRKGDSTLLRSTFSEGAILQSISKDKNGVARLSTKTANDLVKQVGTPHPQVLDERIVFDAIKIDGDLASVWTPYKFYRGDQFSHCGVNAFQLLRTADGWKVIYVVYTVRNNDCIQ